VLLGGYVSGRDAIDLVEDTGGTVVAALSYPYDGDPQAKGWRVVLAAPAIRRALLDTPPAILLAIDFLAAEPYVDPQRIELVGVSLGAPFACVAGALDGRVRRVWSIHGAGDPYALLEHGLERKIPFAPARAVIAGLADVAACGPGLAPEKWVGEIAPRSFVMVNAESDERLPRECIEKLYAAAGEPREILWRPGKHVEPDRKRIVQDLVDIVLERVHETDAGNRRRYHPAPIPEVPR
jgi:dienelactone hydrolase